MRDIQIYNNNNKLADYDSPIIEKWMNEPFSNRLQSIISDFSQIAAGSANLRKIIDPEKIYVAKFPKEIMDKMKSGQYAVMKAKNGDLLSNVIDKYSPKKTVVHQIRLDEVDPNLLQNIQNLSVNITNLAIQSQLAEVSGQLMEIHEIVAKVDRGQKLDRMALVQSGKYQLEQALHISDNNTMRDQLITGAIQTLNNGCSQLYLFLDESLKNMKPIPRSKFRIILKGLFDPKFYSDLKSTYNDMQEGFQMYIYGINLLAAIYERTGNKEVLPYVFEPTREFISTHANRALALSSITSGGNVNRSNCWFVQPDKFVDRIIEYGRHALLDDVEYISVEFKGEQLLIGGKTL